MARLSIEGASRALASKLDPLLDLAITVDSLLPRAGDVTLLLDGGEELYSESLRVDRGSDGEDPDSDDDDVPSGGGGGGDEGSGSDGVGGAAPVPLREGTSGEGAEQYTVSIDAGGMGFTIRRRKLGGSEPGTSDLSPNNAIMMPIIDKDFSQGKTVEFVSWEAGRWVNKLVRLAAEDGVPDDEIDCPMATAGVRVPVLVDGKPALQALLCEVEPAIDISEFTYFSAGGWHTVKATMKHLCRLFAHLLTPIIKMYGRTTSGRIVWFMDPSDPRQ